MPANYSGQVILMVLECWSVGVVVRNSILKAFPPICLLVKSLPSQRHQRSMISSVRAGPSLPPTTTTGLVSQPRWRPGMFLLTNGSVNTSDILIK